MTPAIFIFVGLGGAVIGSLLTIYLILGRIDLR